MMSLPQDSLSEYTLYVASELSRSAALGGLESDATVPLENLKTLTQWAISRIYENEEHKNCFADGRYTDLLIRSLALSISKDHESTISDQLMISTAKTLRHVAA